MVESLHSEKGISVTVSTTGEPHIFAPRSVTDEREILGSPRLPHVTRTLSHLLHLVQILPNGDCPLGVVVTE